MSMDVNRDSAFRYFNEVVGAGNLELIEELVHPEAQDLSGEWSLGLSTRQMVYHLAG